ncbi:DUF6339 family protein [Saccharopolyspora sp. NPDC050389]|uniref:DUF6339 family protein n=1 Tax=Saccharopolyspora sp. NPDC050389 TaxID=3155516 RepID=UPI0033F16AF1
MSEPSLPPSPPPALGSLPDTEVSKHLTADLLAGHTYPPAEAIDSVVTWLGDHERHQADDLRELIEEAMERFADARTASDAWLAPRLHAALRLTKREAADSGIWNYLALRLAPDYVLWRFPPRKAKETSEDQVNAARFAGKYHTQAFARLWWAAELFRDGPDYRPVEIFCGNQDMLGTTLRLDIALHRATAQALVRLLERGIVHTGREVNALAKAVNSAGTTLLFEALGETAPSETGAYRDWVDRVGVHIPYERLPEGPPDGSAPPESIERLLVLFEKLFKEAPVRGKASRDEDTA